ncbi:hypothetical protein [Vibrio parahaemolyticus]|nr:hypothetical protein [Vibrio parahaemolyticus]
MTGFWLLWFLPVLMEACLSRHRVIDMSPIIFQEQASVTKLR